MSSFYLGPYQVSPDQCLLQHEGLDIKLTPRNMDVLVYLAKHAQRVVTSSELLDNFWSPVASDHAVHKAISELRGALGDNVRKQHCIKTLPRRGYMMLLTPNDGADDQPRESRLKTLLRRLTAGVDMRGAAAIGGVTVALLAALLLLRPASFAPEPQASMASVGIQNFDVQGERPDSVDFLREGLQNGLINQLSRLKEVRIVAVDGNGEQALQTARQRGLEHMLQGTFLQADGKMRIQVQLRNVADGTYEYSEQFDLDQGGVFNVQDHIISNVVTALSIHLDDRQREQMYDWGTSNAVAYERFMKGDFYYNQFNPADFERAISLYQEATKLDPDFINAYVGEATAANNLSVFARIDKQRELLKLVGEVHREVASRAPNSEALDSIRAIEMRMAGNEYRRQEQLLREQILSGHPPGYALAHYALFLISARLYDEAGRFLDAAAETRPYEITPDETWDYRVTIASPEEAISLRKDQLMVRPRHIGLLGPMARDLYYQGKTTEAQWYLERLREEDTEGLVADYATQVIAALSGKLKPGSEALQALYNRGQDYYFNNGVVAFILGDVETGINFWARLEPLQKRRLLNMAQVSERYYPASVLHDPHYQQLLDNLDVGKSWQHTLMEGVLAMQEATGVTLSDTAMEAYRHERFVVRNTAWDADFAEETAADDTAHGTALGGERVMRSRVGTRDDSTLLTVSR